VVDAHDGSPIAGASIVVRSAALDGDGVLIRATSDAHGEFAFELPASATSDGGVRPEAARIEAEARRHSRESRSLPSGGTLRIALVTRRRALLDVLTRWARRQGPPFDRQPEPTPAEVRHAAERRDDVRQWAGEIESAAFGPADVDAGGEAQIRDAEPR
jgi:hypothetical protein